MRTVVYLLAMLMSVSFATIVIIQPDATAGCDTTLKQQFPDTNYATAVGIVADNNPSTNQTFLLRFDLTPYSCQNVVTARLELYSYSATGSGQLHINRVLAPWNENTVTWNNAPNYQWDVTYIGTLGNMFTWTQVNMVALVQYWVSHPTFNYGMRGSIPTSGVNRTFSSSDRVNASEHPRLILEYTPGTPVEPTSLGAIRATFN